MRQLFAGAALLTTAFCHAGSTAEFHKAFAVTNAEPVRLIVDVTNATVEIVYSRDGGVSINATAQAKSGSPVDENYFLLALSTNQSGNNITVKQAPSVAYLEENIKFRLRVEVPYRTEIKSALAEGKLVVRGVTGPVDAKAGKADVDISYVSSSVRVDARQGNLDFQMVGDRVEAQTASGNISGERLLKGIHAETGDGDIKLMVVGPSEATVRTGAGRVEIGGARDTLAATTDAGEVHLQAVPHNDWRLFSKSGSIRMELPEAPGFALEASTESGMLQFERDDLPKLSPDVHHIAEKIAGGGKKIVAHSESGNISIR